MGIKQLASIFSRLSPLFLSSRRSLPRSQDGDKAVGVNLFSSQSSLSLVSALASPERGWVSGSRRQSFLVSSLSSRCSHLCPGVKVLGSGCSLLGSRVSPLGALFSPLSSLPPLPLMAPGTRQGARGEGRGARDEETSPKSAAEAHQEEPVASPAALCSHPCP
jgi:hypothetical protein